MFQCHSTWLLRCCLLQPALQNLQWKQTNSAHCVLVPGLMTVFFLISEFVNYVAIFILWLLISSSASCLQIMLSVWSLCVPCPCQAHLSVWLCVRVLPPVLFWQSLVFVCVSFASPTSSVRLYLFLRYVLSALSPSYVYIIYFSYCSSSRHVSSLLLRVLFVCSFPV